MYSTKLGSNNYQMHHLNQNPIHKPPAKIEAKPLAAIIKLKPVISKPIASKASTPKVVTPKSVVPKPVVNTSRVIYPSKFVTRKCNCHSKVGIWS